MATIQTIIFDLGGVLINIDPQRAVDAFVKLGASSPAFQSTAKSLFPDFELGHIDADAFREVLRKQINPNVSDAFLDAAWNATLLDLPEERIEILKKTRKQYRIFLLSNTNSIHIREIEQKLGEEQYRTFIALFEKCYFSFELGICKPDAAIFRQLLKEQELKPEETLFIDDTAVHIETARNLGIHTWHLQVKKESIASLDRVLSKLHSYS